MDTKGHWAEGKGTRPCRRVERWYGVREPAFAWTKEGVDSFPKNEFDASVWKETQWYGRGTGAPASA